MTLLDRIERLKRIDTLVRLRATGTPDTGFVYGNINRKPVSHIKDITIQKAVYKLLLPESSWFNTRANSKICSECLFNAFCPSISSCEYALNKNNLCRIK